MSSQEQVFDMAAVKWLIIRQLVVKLKTSCAVCGSKMAALSKTSSVLKKQKNNRGRPLSLSQLWLDPLANQTRWHDVTVWLSRWDKWDHREPMGMTERLCWVIGSVWRVQRTEETGHSGDCWGENDEDDKTVPQSVNQCCYTGDFTSHARINWSSNPEEHGFDRHRHREHRCREYPSGYLSLSANLTGLKWSHIV